ncbi:MAG: hypothetical protein WBD64_06845 [Candidatus Zixiibacteriota bacterium]
MLSRGPKHSAAADDDELLRLRLSNAFETLKRTQRLFALIYLLFAVVLYAWFYTIFETSPLEKKIDELEEALAVESLKPWDNFLRRTSSCYDSYFDIWRGVQVVTHSQLKKRIEDYKAWNKEGEWEIAQGLKAPYPVAKLENLLQSKEHWEDCRYCAQQDTLVSFLFRLHTYVFIYYVRRTNAQYEGRLEQFWAESDSINAYVDSVLGTFAARLDTLKQPLERLYQHGSSPIWATARPRTTLWSEYWDFDEYGRLDLADLASSLQILNHVSRFKHEVNEHRHLLNRVQPALESIMQRTMAQLGDSSVGQTGVSGQPDLRGILSSHLFESPDLPDTIQLPRLFQISYGYLADGLFSDSLLYAYFPGYRTCVENYRADKVGAIRTLRNMQLEQRGFAKQRIHLLGAEMSATSVFYFLPLAIIALYFLVYLLIRHLNLLLPFSDITAPNAPGRPELAAEVMKGPVLLALGPNLLARFLILFPGLGIALLLLLQLLLPEIRAVSADWRLVVPLVAVQLILLSAVSRSAALLQNLAKPLPLCTTPPAQETGRPDIQDQKEDSNSSEEV